MSAEGLIAVGTSPYYHEYAADNFAVFQKIFLQCEDIRRSGSAAFDLAHVAEGSTEAYFERNLKIWDYAAGLLLIREAGGNVTDYEDEVASMMEQAIQEVCSISSCSASVYLRNISSVNSTIFT